MRDMAGFLPPCLVGWSRKAPPQFTTRAPAARFGTLPRSSTTTIIASGSEEPTDRDGRHAAVTNRPRTGPTKVHRTLCTASRPGKETVMIERRISRSLIAAVTAAAAALSLAAAGDANAAHANRSPSGSVSTAQSGSGHASPNYGSGRGRYSWCYWHPYACRYRATQTR
jgi:hypothetical protein